MGIINLLCRRKPGTPQPPIRECDHKWTDIKIDGDECWYIDFTIDGRNIDYSIYEPYVCIHCKKRKDVCIESEVYHEDSNKSAWKRYRDIRELYPQIKERAVVEDAVNDLQLVDRDYLRIAANVMGVKFF